MTPGKENCFMCSKNVEHSLQEGKKYVSNCLPFWHSKQCWIFLTFIAEIFKHTQE